ncbi:hypothetical protein [Alicyclobacillus kakegawensis]|uniref:hypothetical protein n=1 Tax=Alicyclobacillus kakegawensis TaxID=392012 RepID=UPI00082FE623|nr:hypothetical protein [Alicyclobacillus kakegawensis]
MMGDQASPLRSLMKARQGQAAAMPGAMRSLAFLRAPGASPGFAQQFLAAVRRRLGGEPERQDAGRAPQPMVVESWPEQPVDDIIVHLDGTMGPEQVSDWLSHLSRQPAAERLWMVVEAPGGLRPARQAALGQRVLLEQHVGRPVDVLGYLVGEVDTSLYWAAVQQAAFNYIRRVAHG